MFGLLLERVSELVDEKKISYRLASRPGLPRLAKWKSVRTSGAFLSSVARIHEVSSLVPL